MPDLVQFHKILVLIICASSKGSAIQSLHTVDSEFFVRSLFSGIALHRGSYVSAHVLLNLLNELGKSDKMLGLLSILLLFGNKFNKFNNTGA